MNILIVEYVLVNCNTRNKIIFPHGQRMEVVGTVMSKDQIE